VAMNISLKTTVFTNGQFVFSFQCPGTKENTAISYK